jgi:hypothetical protein
MPLKMCTKWQWKRESGTKHGWPWWWWMDDNEVMPTQLANDKCWSRNISWHHLVWRTLLLISPHLWVLLISVHQSLYMCYDNNSVS